MIPFHDIGNNVVGGLSVKPGTTASANGDWVDMGLSVGNTNAALILGSATGAPTSYLATMKLQEADDSSGTGVADISGATVTVADAAPATNDKTVTYVNTGIRSKRWVRTVTTITHTAGTSPTLPHATLIQALKAKI